MVDGPETDPGITGIEFTVTARVCTLLEPQPLFAATVMLPLVALAIVDILKVVLVPDQPPGKVHV
jgi:hypothetical protein